MATLEFQFSFLPLDEQASVIPGLPNDLACICLACLPLSQHANLRRVCKAWNNVLSSPFLLHLRQTWGKVEEFLCLFRNDPSLIRGELFNPQTQAWGSLPPMPCDPSTYYLTNFQCAASGANLFVIGGSRFDARSYPLGRPLPSPAVFRFDPLAWQWHRADDMRVPRGSFACTASEDHIIVAGGGSRHAQFPAAGDHIAGAELYEVRQNRWHVVQGLRKVRAGCAGFLLGDEFWVMGGYGDPARIAGVLPTDEHYRDGEVLNLKTWTWRELGPMWEEGERRQLGKVAVMGAKDGKEAGVFMLDESVLYRYEAGCNRWVEEVPLPLKVCGEAPCWLIALHDELYVITEGLLKNSRQNRKRQLIFQVYEPRQKVWRFILTKPPFIRPQSNPWTAVCTLCL